MDNNSYKMTYYVGAMLAQGGVFYIKEDRLVFSPGTVERAVGYNDTVIPFEKIKMVEVVGTITESLMIRTLEKAHRFVGGDVNKIRDRVSAAMDSYHPVASAAPAAAPVSAPVQAHATAVASAPAAPAHAPAAAPKVESNRCKSCSNPIRAEYRFCPSCHAVLVPTCSQCFRSVESGWKYCAFCGKQQA